MLKNALTFGAIWKMNDGYRMSSRSAVTLSHPRSTENEQLAYLARLKWPDLHWSQNNQQQNYYWHLKCPLSPHVYSYLHTTHEWLKKLIIYYSKKYFKRTAVISSQSSIFKVIRHLGSKKLTSLDGMWILMQLGKLLLLIKKNIYMWISPCIHRIPALPHQLQ